MGYKPETLELQSSALPTEPTGQATITVGDGNLTLTQILLVCSHNKSAASDSEQVKISVVCTPGTTQIMCSLSSKIYYASRNL